MDNLESDAFAVIREGVLAFLFLDENTHRPQVSDPYPTG